MKSFTYGTTPDDVILQQAKELCPDGYKMLIRDQDEWAAISTAVNAGIDSHLQAITLQSSFCNRTGICNVHPDEVHVLCRRLWEQSEAIPYDENDPDSPDIPGDLRSSILFTLEIEEI